MSARTPRTVSLVGLCSREVTCRALVVREYPSVAKVRYWMGDGWSDVQDAHPDTLIHDDGKLAGWTSVDHKQNTS
ncbi:hypothetical protein [Dietzia alimentaria]|uniref:hypothetical protein n=1 Tax=Dietzia alimentaria TaxID=665550 RepID=UPI00029A1BC1|nr:hypothetical protein [Dietzia alimentaria]